AGALRGDLGRVTLYTDVVNNKRTITIMIRPSGHAQTIDNLIPPPTEPPVWPDDEEPTEPPAPPPPPR
ncbi:MAG: hypothetical protein V1692_02790, partial [bacterium]